MAEKINSAYPDLKWEPRPFVFEMGHSQRFIDFENGDDNNSGALKDSFWKHHPWDKNAKGNAADCRSIHTYCFKKGVVYRGSFSSSPSFRELTDEEDLNYVNEINASGVRVLFVGIGCPKQENWMASHRDKLCCVMVGVGAAFDFF